MHCCCCAPNGRSQLPHCTSVLCFSVFPLFFVLRAPHIGAPTVRTHLANYGTWRNVTKYQLVFAFALAARNMWFQLGSGSLILSDMSILKKKTRNGSAPTAVLDCSRRIKFREMSPDSNLDRRSTISGCWRKWKPFSSCSVFENSLITEPDTAPSRRHWKHRSIRIQIARSEG